MADWTQPPPAGPQDGMSWIDKQFSQTSLVILVIFSLCCGGIAIVLGIFGLVLCKDPKAKRNALVTTVVSGVVTALFVVVQVVAELTGVQRF